MSTPSLSPWKGVTPIYLGNPSYTKSGKTYTAEPSGLTIYSDGGNKWLFMVSDNGIVAKAQLPASGSPTGTLSWQINPTPDPDDKAYDYESVTFANGNLMIGVEGDRKDGSSKTSPVVNRFDQDRTTNSNPAGSFTGSTWTLNGIDFGSQTNSGMEGLTLVPFGSYPSNWTGGTAPHYGGIFFAAVQALAGRVYVYDLAQGGGNSTSVNPLDLGSSASNPLQVPNPSTVSGSKPLISDLFFDASSSALYALYDGEGNSNVTAQDYLQKLTISTASNATAANALTQVWAYALPWLDCEGLAINGNDVYVAIDSGSHPGNDGIFVLPGLLSKL